MSKLQVWFGTATGSALANILVQMSFNTDGIIL